MCACVVSVSADDYSGLAGITQNEVNYIKQTLENAKKLVNGEITVQDAFYSQMSNATELISENVKDINPFQSETELTGVTNRDYANKLTKSVRDCLSQHGGSVIPTESTTQNVDMRGYGAVAVFYDKDGSIYCITYCQYIKYKDTPYFTFIGSGYREFSNGSDNIVIADGKSIGGPWPNNYKLYGDVRDYTTVV